MEGDGEKSCQGENQIEPSDDPEHVCTGFSYGDINRIYYEDDTLWLEASGGVTYADWATPQYEQEVVCKGKIDMDSMGRLTVKDIEFIETE